MPENPAGLASRISHRIELWPIDGCIDIRSKSGTQRIAFEHVDEHRHAAHDSIRYAGRCEHRVKLLHAVEQLFRVNVVG